MTFCYTLWVVLYLDIIDIALVAAILTTTILTVTKQLPEAA